MELPGKILEQTALNTRTKTKEHVLIVTDKSKLEEHLSQPLQTNNKQFKLTVTFLSGYDGILNVTDKNINFYFTVSINDDDFSKLIIPPGAYELESLNNEIERNIIEEGNFTEGNYPFTLKTQFLKSR